MAATTDLIAYAHDTPSATYFDPDTDISVYDDKFDIWRSLDTTTYSLPNLLATLDDGSLDPAHVRLSDEAEAYLTYHADDDLGLELHDDPLMNRRRLLAFAEEGYTHTETLIADADPIDISQDTGVDRETIQQIAARYATGFTTATSTPTGSFSELDPRDDFEGWTLVHATDSRIRWVTAGRFNLTLSDGDYGVILECNLPSEEKHTWYRKGHSIEIEASDEQTPESALSTAHDWLNVHQIRLDDELTRIPYIGPATCDYLALAYGITSYDELEEFVADNPDTFESLFRSNAPAVRTALDEV